MKAFDDLNQARALLPQGVYIADWGPDDDGGIWVLVGRHGAVRFHPRLPDYLAANVGSEGAVYGKV